MASITRATRRVKAALRIAHHTERSPVLRVGERPVDDGIVGWAGRWQTGWFDLRHGGGEGTGAETAISSSATATATGAGTTDGNAVDGMTPGQPPALHVIVLVRFIFLIV